MTASPHRASVDLSRRGLLVAGLSVAGGTLLSACGGGGEDDEPAKAETAEARRSTEPGPKTYTLGNLPQQTFASNGQIRTIANPGGKTRPQAFAGPNSSGLLTSVGAACPAAVQFGLQSETGWHHAIAKTDVDNGLERGGKDPDTIRVDSQAGRQWMAGQRLVWTASSRQLRMVCKAGDAIVHDAPRVQLLSHPVPNRSWLRFHCRFQLGDGATAWPSFVTGRNATAIFQLRGDGPGGAESNAVLPVLALEIRENTASVDSNLVDVVLLRRTENRAGAEQEVCRVRGLARLVPHDFIVEICADWKGAEVGGAASLSLLHDGQRVPLSFGVGTTGRSGDRLTTASIYGAAMPDLYRGIWGIHRHRYTRPAPDDACIVWHRAEIEISDEAFDVPVDKAAAA